MHHTALRAATSSYRIPDVIMDIALDAEGKGSYEHISRRPGRNLVPTKYLHLEDPNIHNENKPVFIVDPDKAGSIHYAFVTPDYILSSYRWPVLPESQLTAIHSQARWQGAIFKGAQDCRIYPQCSAASINFVLLVNYNQHRSVQYKNTAIYQKLFTSLYAIDMRVFFSTSGPERMEKDGWVFAEAPKAFAAVKVVEGSYKWDDENWLRCDYPYSPVIFELAKKRDYENFEAFRQDVLDNELEYDGKTLNYIGLSGKKLTLYPDSDQSPEIDAEKLSYAPEFTFKSPFMLFDTAKNECVISKDDRELRIKF